MPSNCWGSREIVNKWIQSFKNREWNSTYCLKQKLNKSFNGF
jgi:hypothetical protein